MAKPSPKTVLITGASIGTGAETAKLFAAKGTVAAPMRDTSRVSSLPASAIRLPLDVTDERTPLRRSMMQGSIKPV